MREKFSKKEPTEDNDKSSSADRLLTPLEAFRMLGESEKIKDQLKEFSNKGFIITQKKTETPGLFEITIRDPFTDQIVFYENEELLYGERKKNVSGYDQ